jgi:membrane protein required for colicin V production
MNVADWVIVGAIVLSAVVAASQGFFFEVVSLAGTVVGYLVASWRYKQVSAWLAPHVTSTWVADIAGFLIIFIAVVILAGLVAKVARWIVKEVGLSWFDRTLGAVFGVLRGGLVVAVVSLVMTSFTPSSRLLTGSELAPYFLVVGRAAIWLAPSELRARFYQGLDLLHHSKPDQESRDRPAAR